MGFVKRFFKFYEKIFRKNFPERHLYAFRGRGEIFAGQTVIPFQLRQVPREPHENVRRRISGCGHNNKRRSVPAPHR